jgi:hypothetical protein
MRPWKRAWLASIWIVPGIIFLIAAGVQAQGNPPPQADIIQGAVLYDNWFAALGVQAPPGNMPIWSRQSTNSRSGPDTWRCVECHGWDYHGAQGAYATGSHLTGFPDVMTLAAQMSEADITAHLKGANDPAHDFSAYLDETSMLQLAVFLKFGTIDDSLYIDPISMRVIGGDSSHGKTLFETTCTGRASAWLAPPCRSAPAWAGPRRTGGTCWPMSRPCPAAIPCPPPPRPSSKPNPASSWADPAAVGGTAC